MRFQRQFWQKFSDFMPTTHHLTLYTAHYSFVKPSSAFCAEVFSSKLLKAATASWLKELLGAVGAISTLV